jgi:hypothetical protein
MLGRILRIELRRSSAVFLALLLLLVGAVLLMSYPEGFEGRWMQLAVATRLALLVMLPLALGGGAWLGRRDALHRVGELFASTVRPRWQRVIPAAAAYAIAVVTAYVLVFAVGALWVAPSARYFPAAAFGVAAVGALSLVAAGWLGMAAGRAVPRLFTAPALAVLGAAVAGMLPIVVSESAMMTTGRAGPAAMLLTPIHDGNIGDFQTIAARVTGTQALWLTLLAVTGLLLLGAARRRSVALAVVPAVLGAAIALPLLPAGGYRAAAAADPAAGRLVCDDSGPQVCLAEVHAYLLPDVVRPARQALTLLAAKVPGAPTRAVESIEFEPWLEQDRAPAPRPAGQLTFGLVSAGISDRAEYGDGYFLAFLLASAWEPDCATSADDVWTFQAVGAAWLRGSTAPLAELLQNPADRQLAGDVYQSLAGLPQAEQARRMAQAHAAAQDCSAATLLPILSGNAR